MELHLEEIEYLLRTLESLREALLLEESKASEKIKALPLDARPSAVNLTHYLCLRRHDLRQLQRRLASLGLSSLGRSEGHVLATLNSVIAALGRMTGRSFVSPTSDNPSIEYFSSRSLLETRTQALFGPKPANRNVRVMVTMPSEGARDGNLIKELLEHGMNCMRINCAHDHPQSWALMIENLARARRDLGLECKVQMDLGGPKLRTGTLPPFGRLLSWHPERDIKGKLVRPAHVLLTTPDKYGPPQNEDARMFMPADFLSQLANGDSLDFTDNRGARRQLKVLKHDAAGVMCEAERTAYVSEGISFQVASKALCACVSGLPEVVQPIVLLVGHELVLTRDQSPGCGALRDEHGALISPARIACTLPEIFPALKPGERVWLDDGKIGGVIEAGSSEEIRVRISHARAKGSRLLPDKGINLPDSTFQIAALTGKDREDLRFVGKHADLVGLSFVNSSADILDFHNELRSLGAPDLGYILKIETRMAFEKLPELLMSALIGKSAGIMIARGDLAVEMGFERLAEVQEEILWMCEAAHVPVIWATQVLESMAKKGIPSRAEITDAAMSERAECVMLNKGPHIVAVMRALNSILSRMQDHQDKKMALLRPLHF